MKNITFILFLGIQIVATSQNIVDSYKSHTGEHEWPGKEINEGWDGEYQIFLDKFVWNCYSDGSNVFEPAAVSFSMEVVSFPFIPDNFPESGSSSGLVGVSREQNTLVASNSYYYGKIYSIDENDDTIFRGIGWEYGDFMIYQKFDNTYRCDTGSNYACGGDYALISPLARVSDACNCQRVSKRARANK